MSERLKQQLRGAPPLERQLQGRVSLQHGYGEPDENGELARLTVSVSRLTAERDAAVRGGERLRAVAAEYRAKYLDFRAHDNEFARRAASDQEAWRRASTSKQLAMIGAYQRLYEAVAGEPFDAVLEEAAARLRAAASGETV